MFYQILESIGDLKTGDRFYAIRCLYIMDVNARRLVSLGGLRINPQPQGYLETDKLPGSFSG